MEIVLAGGDTMNPYERLQEHAESEGLIVKEFQLKSSDGKIMGNRIAIRKDIPTSIQKAGTLAEELGHYHTSVGCILDQTDQQNRKQECQARFWGYNKMIGLTGIINAFKAKCQNKHEIAEYLEVTDEYLKECIDCYRNKYGVYTTVDNYIIYFIPSLAVIELI